MVKAKMGVSRVIYYVVLAFLGAITLIPLVWMVSTSLKPPQEVYTTRFFPIRPTLANYAWIMGRGTWARYFFNSGFVAATVTGASLFLSSLTGFVLAKYDFRGREIAFWSIIACLMIPFPVICVPLFEVVAKLGWVDSYWGLIIPLIINPFGVFMMRQFIKGIPSDLIDSARLDGCHELGIYFRIIVPLITTPLAVLTVFYFMWNWDSFLWPMLVVQTQKLITLPLGLATFGNQYYTRYNYVMAGAVLAVIPVVVVYAIFQKQIIKGMTLSGLKF